MILKPPVNSSDLEPLLYPDVWPEPSAIELTCRWVPIVGWLVGAVLERRRTGPIERNLYSQFESRPPHAVDYWRDEAQSRVAHVITDSCVQACGWPHSHFIPDDSLGVMLEFRTGDLCELDAIFRIEKALGVKLNNAEWQLLVENTLRDAVDYFLSQSDAAANE